MKTFDEVLTKFPEDIRARYNFTSACYTGALKRITGVKCPVHGEFSQYAAQFRKGRGCPKCGDEARVTKRRTPIEEYFAAVTEIHGGKYDYTKSNYVSMNSRITIKCPIHGEFSTTANRHYYRKQGCGVCERERKQERIIQYRHLSSQSKVNNTAKTFFARCAESHDNRYSYPEQEYLGAKTKIIIECPEHGVFTQAAWAHLSGKGCFLCGASDPKWERELVLYLTERGIEVQRNVPILDKRHIDIYVPDRKIGIELHGLRWHTENMRDKNYHRGKWEIASELGIRLVQIFEDEWNEKKGIVKSRLDALFGISPTYDARKCTITRLEPTIAKDFLNNAHIQGSGNARLYYGLVFSGDLIAVASFGPSRSGAMVSSKTLGEWEVLRYASIGRVRGGFSRLFKRFVGDVTPKQVISYCDLRYGDGKLYRATGFYLSSITEPDYWWVPDGKIKRIPRYITQKHKLKTHPELSAFYAPEKTEAEICHAAGWSRIYGVGNQKWIWTP